MNLEDILVRRLEALAQSQAITTHYLHLIRLELGLEPKASLDEVLDCIRGWGKVPK